MSSEIPEVLIVGAGPVGLTAALLFHELGHSVRIVERRSGTQRAPAAHVINARTFEVWRQIGLDVELIRSRAQTPDVAGMVHFVTLLGGEVLGSLQYEQQGDDSFDKSPTPLRNLSQHRLEPLLVDELMRRGISVEYNTSWIGLEQHDGFVRSTISSADTLTTVDSQWLIACDGSSSAVRTATGITMEGPDNLQQFSMIHFRAELAPLLTNQRGILYWVCDPRSDGTFVSHGGDNEWVYMYPRSPLNDDSELSTEGYIEKVTSALAVTGVSIDILRYSTWTMTSQLATSYQDKRVLLAGDAAHRFPPTGGMGLNTGVQDVHNLAWKLHEVMTGTQSVDFLNTYQSERRPIAERNAQASLENAFKMIEVFLALGADPDPAISAAQFETALATPSSRDAVLRAIENQSLHFDMLGLQIGYRYILDSSNSPIEPLTDATVRRYIPSSEPGNRLPHGWLLRNGATISSLDMIPLDQHVLIAGPDFVTEDSCIRIGLDVDDPSDWWTSILMMPRNAALRVRPDQHIEDRLSPLASHPR